MKGFATEVEHTLQIPVSHSHITGSLKIPLKSQSLIIFAHGSGSGRLSNRNRYVADCLHKAGHATLLFDLLTEEEEKVDVYTRKYRFDIDLLATRLILVKKWCEEKLSTYGFALGFFGASTGAAAALKAAACEPNVKAVVSRGGRPDLAYDALTKVKAPTLLIVGGLDHEVIILNQNSKAKMNCLVDLKLIEGAGHLFEEPGKLNEVAVLAIDWFNQFLKAEDGLNARKNV